jgi:hypothetical protein
MTSSFLTLTDDTIWPAPAGALDLAHSLRHPPRDSAIVTLTTEEALVAASILEAYAALCCDPPCAAKLPMIRRALRKQGRSNTTEGGTPDAL